MNGEDRGIMTGPLFFLEKNTNLLWVIDIQCIEI